MENKFSPNIKSEVEDILKNLDFWNNYFSINLEFYFDGWSIFLKEKNLYPRCIVIFKSYNINLFSIKSFEVHLNNYKEEKFKEIYSVENINNKNFLFKELKEIIYGKDILNDASKIYRDRFLR